MSARFASFVSVIRESK